MYLGSHVVCDSFGERFELCVNRNPPSDKRLKHRYFSSEDEAERFVCYLDVDEHRWFSYLGHLLHHGHVHGSIYTRVARLVSRGEVQFYEIPNLDKATPVASANGKALQFSQSLDYLKHSHRAARVSIGSRSEAEALVQALTSKEITAVLRDIGDINPATTGLGNPGSSQQQLINRLIKGEVWVWKVEHRPHSPGKNTKAEVVPATELPGNRQVPLAPESEPQEPTFKREHRSGAATDPYTLQADGNPLGAKVGVMPPEMFGLDELPEGHDELVSQGYPSLNIQYSPRKFTQDFANFSTAEPDILPPGTKIYRIVDEAANPAGSYWATELPSSKAGWRGDYAVKDSWNDNGYFTEYTVPEGEGLKVWRGKTAGQEYREHDGKNFYLEGGNEQLFIARNAVSPEPKKLTNWSDATL